jgi:MYXO-CTERM domain-containing protein
MVRRSLGLWLTSLGVALVAGCAPPQDAGRTERRAGALAAGDPGDLDILFMIDNSSSMTTMQAKLLAQDPSFMKVLQGFPNGLPNIHVAVVSSDMGAPGDETASIGCTPQGDDGEFQAAPRGTCTSTTLEAGATFISNVGGSANYTGKLEDVFSCIAELGSTGCGFEHQLASVARALGADGAPPPIQNAGFLRPNAELAIVLLTNEDDCSAPPNTTLFSLNGGQQSLTNPLGPIANYRCNQFGHLCNDPTSATPTALIAPPLNPPADATAGSPPTLTLANCQSNDTGGGLLTPVAQLVAGIRALKTNPDDQIVVGAISPPVTPYTVGWFPAVSPPAGVTGELWPQLFHSCGANGGNDVNPQATQFTTDGTFGDPGVRVAQWVRAFGENGVVASICDADYGAAFQTIADKIQAHLQPSSSFGAGGAGGASSGAAGAGAAGVGGGPGGQAGTPGGAGPGGASGAPGAGGAGTAGAVGAADGGASGAGGASGGAGGAAPLTGGGGAFLTGAAGAGGSGGHAGASAGGAGGQSPAGGAGGHGPGGGSAGAGAGGGPATSSGSSSGCGCETAPRLGPASNLGLLLVALGLVVRRRRRV